MADSKPREDERRIDIDAPAEGFMTLAARFTGDVLKRATDVVQRMKAAGMPEARIIARLRTDLRQLDERSLKLIYNKALGGTTEDTFGADEITAVQETKPGTFEVTLARPRMDVSIGSVVQYKSAICTVTRLTKGGYVIKKLA
jgi:hypothetical protein